MYLALLYNMLPLYIMDRNLVLTWISDRKNLHSTIQYIVYDHYIDEEVHMDTLSPKMITWLYPESLQLIPVYQEDERVLLLQGKISSFIPHVSIWCYGSNRPVKDFGKESDKFLNVTAPWYWYVTPVKIQSF